MTPIRPARPLDARSDAGCAEKRGEQSRARARQSTSSGVTGKHFGPSRIALAVGCAAVWLSSCNDGSNPGAASRESAAVATSADAPGSTMSSPSLPSAPTTTATSNQASQHPVLYEWREYIGMDALNDLFDRTYVEYQRHIQICMLERGFEYLPIQSIQSEVDSRRALNPLNEAVASEWGYHLPPNTQEGIIDNNIHSPAFDEALDGADYNDPGPGQSTLPSTGLPGCAQQAAKLVFAITEPVSQVAQELLNSLYDAVDGYQTTPEGQGVVAAWAQCMQDRGFDLKSPQEGTDRFAGAAEVTSEELATRAADLQCDRITGLTEAQSAWERQRFERWQQDFAAQWNDFTQLIDAATQALDDLDDKTS